MSSNMNSTPLPVAPTTSTPITVNTNSVSSVGSTGSTGSTGTNEQNLPPTPAVVLEKHDNPIDNFFYKFSEPVADWMNKNGFNSSGIVTLSLVFGILALKLIGDKSFTFASLSYIAFYFLDYVNEVMDKKYNMTTKFGSNYYMLKNIIINSLIAYTIYTNYSNFEGCTSKLFFLGLICMLIIGTMHIGCQKINNGSLYLENESLISKLSIGICPATNKDEAIDIMKYTKYFSQSTWIVGMGVLIFLMGEFMPK